MVSYCIVLEISELLSGASDAPNLDVAALQLSAIEFPGLEFDGSLGILDEHAGEVARRLGGGTSGADYVSAANEYLFAELGFRGNETDYYNPHNSCLNAVLTSRQGIPITLSVVYIEIGRRLGRTIHGIGLPGHFLAKYDDGEYSALIDTFSEGKILSPEDCREIATQTSGVDIADDLSLLQPVSKRYILIRMLNNLRAIYFGRKAHRKALSVLDLLLLASPESSDEYRQRAMVNVQLQQFQAARHDFERYLALAPEAPDRDDVESQLKALHGWIARMN